MTRVLVLGAQGRIGTLLRRGWTRDNTLAGFAFQTRDTTAIADILWDVLTPLPRTLISTTPFDCMLVLSGIVPRPGADFALNTAIGLSSVKAAAHLGIPSVLMASTSAVYGTHQDHPFHESDPAKPLNDYGRSKLEMEARCHALANTLGINLCCLRIGNVAGADALLINGAALGADQRLQIESFTDGGTPLRSYIGPQSLARAMHTLTRMHARLPETLNVATQSPITMQALAEAANMSFTLNPVTNNAHQQVTLECSALTKFHRFDPEEAKPAEMVRQWHALKD